MKKTTSYNPVVPLPPADAVPNYSPSYTPSVFPLKLKSKGAYVTTIQLALIKKYGAKILPRNGANGDFGTELQSALISLNLPHVIYAIDYDNILTALAPPKNESSSNTTNQNSSSTKNDQSKSNGSNQNQTTTAKQKQTFKHIALKLKTAIENNHFSECIKELKQIKSTDEYVLINAYFSSEKIDGLLKMSIVTALLRSFPSDSDQKQLNSQFYRIGLRYNSSQWSLSGIDSKTIVTVQPAKVWDENKNEIVVPRSTILGEFIRAKNGICEFRTLDGKKLYVSIHLIAYMP